MRVGAGISPLRDLVLIAEKFPLGTRLTVEHDGFKGCVS